MALPANWNLTGISQPEEEAWGMASVSCHVVTSAATALSLITCLTFCFRRCQPQTTHDGPGG